MLENCWRGYPVASVPKHENETRCENILAAGVCNQALESESTAEASTERGAVSIQIVEISAELPRSIWRELLLGAHSSHPQFCNFQSIQSLLPSMIV